MSCALKAGSPSISSSTLTSVVSLRVIALIKSCGNTHGTCDLKITGSPVTSLYHPDLSPPSALISLTNTILIVAPLIINTKTTILVA